MNIFNPFITQFLLHMLCICCKFYCLLYFFAVHNSAFVSDDELALQTDELY